MPKQRRIESLLCALTAGAVLLAASVGRAESAAESSAADSDAPAASVAPAAAAPAAARRPRKIVSQAMLYGAGALSLVSALGYVALGISSIETHFSPGETDPYWRN